MSSKEFEPKTIPWSSDIYKKPWAIITFCTLLAFLVVAIHIGFTPAALSNSFDGISTLFSMMFPPDFGDFNLILDSIFITLGMAFFGTIGAALLSVPAAFLMGRKTRIGNLTANIVTIFASISRSIPDLVFALIIITLLGIGPLSGALAILIGSTGAMVRLFANSIDQNDQQSRHALINLGVNRVSASVSATLREVLPSFISVVIYRFEINVKTSTVLGIVGAGGIGSSLRNSLVTFDFTRASAIAISLIATIFILEIISMSSRYALIGSAQLPFNGTNKRNLFSRIQKIPKAAVLISVSIIAFIGLVGSVHYVISGFTPRNRDLDIFMQVITQLAMPDFFGSGSNLFLLMFETVEIGFLATVIGAVLGMPLAIYASWNVAPTKNIFLISRTLMALIRGMPSVMFALIFVTGIGLGPVAGVLAMSIASLGLCSKLTADSIEMALPGPRVAVISLGASRPQEFFAAVFPQVKSQILSNVLFALDINVRQATLLGLVGAGGIGYALVEAVNLFQFDTVSAIVLLIISTVLMLELVAKQLKASLDT